MEKYIAMIVQVLIYALASLGACLPLLAYLLKNVEDMPESHAFILWSVFSALVMIILIFIVDKWLRKFE